MIKLLKWFKDTHHGMKQAKLEDIWYMIILLAIISTVIMIFSLYETGRLDWLFN